MCFLEAILNLFLALFTVYLYEDCPSYEKYSSFLSWLHRAVTIFFGCRVLVSLVMGVVGCISRRELVWYTVLRSALVYCYLVFLMVIGVVSGYLWAERSRIPVAVYQRYDGSLIFFTIYCIVVGVFYGFLAMYECLVMRKRRQEHDKVREAGYANHWPDFERTVAELIIQVRGNQLAFDDKQ